jgi:hypothetical protein
MSTLLFQSDLDSETEEKRRRFNYVIALLRSDNLKKVRQLVHLFSIFGPRSSDDVTTAV